MALGVLGVPTPGAAQTQEELATRRILIERATAARAAGRHAEALTLAQSAGAVRMTPSVRLFIAQQLDATGDPAGALGMAIQCVREVEQDATVAHRAALLATCRELERATRTRIGYLVVRAPEPAPEGVRVTVQGAVLLPALLGVPYVVSPGSVRVEARAPGRSDFSARREVEAGATVPVDLDLPPAEVTPPEVIPSAVAPPAIAPLEATPPPPITPPPAPAPRRPSRVVPGVFLGGGAAALVGGAALLWVRADALDRCALLGSMVECATQEDLTAARRANGLAAGAGVLLGLGALSVGAGVVWLLLNPGASTQPRPWTAAVVPVRGGLSVGLSRSFP